MFIAASLNTRRYQPVSVVPSSFVLLSQSRPCVRWRLPVVHEVPEPQPAGSGYSGSRFEPELHKCVPFTNINVQRLAWFSLVGEEEIPVCSPCT